MSHESHCAHLATIKKHYFTINIHADAVVKLKLTKLNLKCGLSKYMTSSIWHDIHV
jgi:hypothetical protein